MVDGTVDESGDGMAVGSDVMTISVGADDTDGA